MEVIKVEKAIETYIKDCTKPFPVETQVFVLKLHQRLVNFGFKCEVKNKRFSTVGNYFLYSYKRKRIEDIWIIKINPNDCALRFNAKYASIYADFIENLPSYLLNIITTGDGCSYNPMPEKCQAAIIENKFGMEYIINVNGTQYIKCNSKCCAACDFWIPLTDLTIEVNQAIEDWIELELSHL